jgi:hypothetical protein
VEAKRCAFNPGTENPELYQLLELNNKIRSGLYLSSINYGINTRFIYNLKYAENFRNDIYSFRLVLTTGRDAI